VAGVLLCWPLAVQFHGAQQVHGAIQPHEVAVSDLLTPVVPTPIERLAPARALAHARQFTGHPGEVSGYLGVPLVLLLAFLAVRLRRDPLVALLTPLFAVTAVFAFGGHLHVDGRITDIWLPWSIAQDLPLLGSALPSRFALYLTMFAGLALAVWLERARLGTTSRRLGAGAVAVVALAPLWPAPMQARPLRTPAFFTSAAVQAIPAGSTVLVLPYPRPDDPSAMLWQAQAHYRFDLPGCYCTVPDGHGRSRFYGEPSPLTTAVLGVESGTQTADAALRTPGLAQAYRTLRPDAVVVGPTQRRAELVTLVTSLTGRPPSMVGGVTLWSITP
jgi:hypothetical protein